MIYMVRFEIQVQPEDFKSGQTMGFMNAIVQAESHDSAVSKLKDYLRRFDWHVIEIEENRLIEEDFIFDDDEMQDMLERARPNDQAIILGTFHSYETS